MRTEGMEDIHQNLLKQNIRVPVLFLLEIKPCQKHRNQLSYFRLKPRYNVSEWTLNRTLT